MNRYPSKRTAPALGPLVRDLTLLLVLCLLIFSALQWLPSVLPAWLGARQRGLEVNAIAMGVVFLGTAVAIVRDKGRGK